jgi:hypothetical protein
LKGAKETIEKFRPLIFTEATSEFLSIEALYDEISKFEYDVFEIQSSGKISLLFRNNLVEGNWLAKPKVVIAHS